MSAADTILWCALFVAVAAAVASVWGLFRAERDFDRFITQTFKKEAEK